jgi:hypothetical protein
MILITLSIDDASHLIAVNVHHAFLFNFSFLFGILVPVRVSGKIFFRGSTHPGLDDGLITRDPNNGMTTTRTFVLL